MTDQNQNKEVEVEEAEAETQSSDEPQEVIEVSWEHAEELYNTRASLSEHQQYFASMLLDFEKRRANFLSRISELESSMFSLAESLREEYDVQPELTYELRMPTQIGEKAYFVRKED